MHKISLLLLALTVSNSVFSQNEGRSSSSIYLQPSDKADVIIPFSLTAEGHRFAPTWGLDQAWINEQNLKKGVNHMGKENVGIGRTAYRFTKALVNDSVLAPDVISVLRQRSNIFNSISATLPLVFTADQEAGTNEYYVTNKSANTTHWAAMINSHVHWMQANTQHPIVGVSPFNEPDMWTVEEGATPAKQVEVARKLRQDYPRFADIAIVGSNTLNNDKALDWYTSGKQYYDWGNTHQLAGSFNTFAGFYQQLEKDGKVGYDDEMHNVGEAMIGLEYGMTVGIWWGFDSRARGEFCDISRNGVRLAYAEHRNNWTAASVYRHDDGRVKAFIGSSERQAATTSYLFVSPERDVYFDGYGPLRDFRMEIPGGTGYQKGQTNAERVINVTWGEDVQPDVIDGTYKIVNKATGNVVAINNTAITQQIYKGTATQQWNVHLVSPRIGGDYSFYNIESVSNARIHINVRDYSTKANAELIAYQQDAPTSNEQWYLEYAGNGYYYIRNRESALYMASVGTASTNNVRVTQIAMPAAGSNDKMLWRFLPLEVSYETVAPAQPASLIAEPQQASVRLTWAANTEDDLAGYMVLRAPQGTEDWNTIARKLTQTTYVDNTCLPNTSYIYKVKAIDQSGNLSACSETASAQPTGEKGLVACWQFDDTLQDATPNMMDCALKGNANYHADHKSGEKSLRLVSTNYLQLPYEVASSDELTIALWVKCGSTANWQRIFDFGNDTDHYLFLTPSNSYTSKLRFAIKNGGDELYVDGKSKLPVNQWKHVAVSIGKDKTTLYVDGEEVASSTGITIKPGDIHPVLNYVGRSQFNADPYFQGNVDDLRIYNYALDGEAVKQVMDDTVSGIAQVEGERDNKASQVFSIDGRRLNSIQPGINIVDGKKKLVK